MKCPYCGTENPDNELFCKKCGLPLNRELSNENAYLHSQFTYEEKGNKYAQRPKNYMVWSVIGAFLCVPTAFIALVYSSKVDTEFEKGNIEAAWRASRMARLWLIISIVISIGYVVGVDKIIELLNHIKVTLLK